MLWRNLKAGFFVTMLVMLAGCSGISIGALESRVDPDISSVAVIDTDGRAGQLRGPQTLSRRRPLCQARAQACAGQESLGKRRGVDDAAL